MTAFITRITLIFFCAFAVRAWGGNPVVEIGDGLVFSGQGSVHSNMLLSLSLETPAVGIAYRGDNESYNRTVEYVGYFNPLKCYDYNGGNRNLVDKENPAEDGYFFIVKDADTDTHECGGGSFSGNFMNWVSASAIDMLRYALTGGDRVYDKADTTILQRAVLPDAESANFYAHPTHFPRRSLTKGRKSSAPGQVTPFDTKTLYVVSCRNRILFSDANSKLTGDAEPKKASSYCSSVFDQDNKDKAETTDKKLGEYLVRVKVCDSNEGATRTALCQSYGNHYKPVGAIQRNAKTLRLAVMGYLLDDSEQRYGGVLRAPMKYVGPKKIRAPGSVEMDNDKQEWDPDTGELIVNPDRSTTESRSGAINYLNQFGRAGLYKRFDPLSELFYEGIRYLQGKPPTPDATEEMTNAMQDGFPVVTDWQDPVTASCQKNTIVSIADANTNWDRYIPGNQRTTYGVNSDAHDRTRPVENPVAGKSPDLDIRTWTRQVGEMEAASDPDLAALDTRDTGSDGQGSYYMAGLAHWASTNDIRMDKHTRVKTVAIDVDDGGNGLIDGNTRAIKPLDSQLYLAAKHGARTGKGPDCDTYGETPPNYFLASQPREMIRSLRTVFENAANESATASGVAISSSRISFDGTFVYQPEFRSSTWCGNLKKLALRLDESGGVTIAASPTWNAGEVLTGKKETAAYPQPADRNIYTSVLANNKFRSPIEFKWEKDPATGKEALARSQKALLNTSPEDGTNDGRGADRVNFLRGDRSLELGHTGGVFRARSSVLGDIINSNPLYVGPPASRVEGDGYQKFRENHRDRAKAVYIGANDGMLHAFSAEDGKELFAYVPNVLIQSLSQLARPDYVHRPYVDGMLSAAEAKVGKEWKTVLAAGMGGGAQGVFALDVTDPAKFGGGSGAIFEFTDDDDPDMGNAVSAPVIAKFRTHIDKNGVAQHKYFVVVPSGLNNYKDDGTDRYSPDAIGALFLLSLDKAAGEKWKEGKNYYKFTTLNTDDGLPNGLNSPALVTDVNGVVRYAYAGDLQGNLWRFDFTGTESWSKSPPKAALLFTAKDDQGTRQPVSTQPKVVFAPGGGYVVLFGSGKFLEKTDAAPSSFTVQSFYGIYDSTMSGHQVSGRDQLSARKLEKQDDGRSLQITGDIFSYESLNGWYFDFPESDKTGERTVTNGVVADGRLFFNTLIPETAPCATGTGRTYILDTLTGLPAGAGSTGFRSTVGILNSPLLLRASHDVGERNATGIREVRKRRSVFNFGTDGVETAEHGGSIVPAGRFSWREIVNWQDLKSQIETKD